MRAGVSKLLTTSEPATETVGNSVVVGTRSTFKLRTPTDIFSIHTFGCYIEVSVVPKEKRNEKPTSIVRDSADLDFDLGWRRLALRFPVSV